MKNEKLVANHENDKTDKVPFYLAPPNSQRRRETAVRGRAERSQTRLPTACEAGVCEEQKYANDKKRWTNDQRITDFARERPNLNRPHNCRSSYHNHVQKSLGKKPT